MNVIEGLRMVRQRLVDNGAKEATLVHVDQIIKRASVPSVGNASAQSLLQLTRMLMRHPAMTTKVMAEIHWEALKLWWKGVPVVPRVTADGIEEGAAHAAAAPAVHARSRME